MIVFFSSSSFSALATFDEDLSFTSIPINEMYFIIYDLGLAVVIQEGF